MAFRLGMMGLQEHSVLVLNDRLRAKRYGVTSPNGTKYTAPDDEYALAGATVGLRSFDRAFLALL